MSSVSIWLKSALFAALVSVEPLLGLHRLLSDAEIAKDVIQDVFRVHLSCDVAQVM